MSTFFGSLFHQLYAGDRVQQAWFGAFALFMILLAVLHHLWKDDEKKLRVWRILCFAPALACVAHFFIYCFGALLAMVISSYIPLYLTAVICAFGALFAKRKIGYKAGSIAAGVLTTVLGVYFCCSVNPFGNFANVGYSAAFKGLVSELKQHYVLTEWKELDLDALEKEFLPEIEEAEKNGDKTAFESALKRFSLRFNDGHVYCYTPDYSIRGELFNDYGLTSVRVDSGEIVAVRVGEEARKAGLYDGAVILKWDGVPINEAAEGIFSPLMAPVKSNEEFVKAMLVTSSGGESVSVEFLDENGNKKTAVLQKLLDVPETFNDAYTLYGREDLASEALERDDFFPTKMVSEKCGYIYLAAETTGETLNDVASYLVGDHAAAREMFRSKLDELSAQGMEYLIIDLRGNMGGYDEIGCALTSLLTDTDAFGQGPGIVSGGRYICVSEHGVNADGAYKELKAIALTNLECISAGDGTALYLSKLPNVTLAGITEPCGCNQETGGQCVLPDGVLFGYPVGLVLDENSVPNIDTKADRVSRNSVEVRIPLDKAAAVRLFCGEGDYELEWAIRTLENMG